LWQSLGSAIVFAWGTYLPFRIKIVILFALLIVSDICLLILHFFIHSLDDVAVNKDPATTVQQHENNVIDDESTNDSVNAIYESD